MWQRLPGTSPCRTILPTGTRARLRSGHSAAVAGIIVSLIYLVGQYTAIAIVLIWLFQIPLWLALVIATLVTMAYTAIGGLYAVAWASLVQSIILIVGVLIMAPIIIWKAGGFTHVNEFIATVNPNLVMPWNPTGAFAPPYVISFALLLARACLCPARHQ